MSELEDLRRGIDEIDARVVDLLAERLRLASLIGAEKEAAGLSLYDPDRERRVLERVVQAAGERLSSEKVRAVFREIISASRSEETGEAILVHGTWGSLAHEAAFRRFGRSASYAFTTRAPDVFAALNDGTCAYAVVSLEGHSLEASLDRLDLFLHTSASLFGESYIRPGLGLYAGSREAAGGPVFGTPAAVAQASRWIERQPRGRELRVVGSAQEAVRLGKEVRGFILGLPVTAALEDLVPVESGIEDVPEATRRFLVLSRHEAPATGKDKTSVLAVIANRPGSLHQVTGVLSRNGINLCWLEPKATHLGLWDHLFILEIEGHRNDPPVTSALEELRKELELLKVLGSYPSEKPPDRPF